MKDETKFLIEIADKFDNLEKVAKALNKTEATESGEGTSHTLLESQPIATESQDGIYLVYADGHAELFNGENDKRNVTYVGVVFRGHRFSVSLTETKAALLPEDEQPTKRTTYKTECESIYDFDSADNTAGLVEDNPELVNYLKPGEAIPALGVLVIMCNLREDIDRAMEYVGGQQLTGSHYWSSTEYSEYTARLVNLSHGGVYSHNKYNDYVVRAVSTF